MILLNGPGACPLGEADRAAALGEVKALVRATTTADDAVLGRLIDTALGLAEAYLGRLQLTRPVRDRITGPGWTALGAAPVTAITAVGDAAGVALAVASYAVDIDARGTGWVRTAHATPMLVDYTAGAAAGWAEIPPPIRSGVALLAAHLFLADDPATPPPAAVTALWHPFREMRLGC